MLTLLALPHVCGTLLHTLHVALEVCQGKKWRKISPEFLVSVNLLRDVALQVVVKLLTHAVPGRLHMSLPLHGQCKPDVGHLPEADKIRCDSEKLLLA